MSQYKRRTTVRRRRELHAFAANNRRLFPFAGLFLLGAALGVAVYAAARPVPAAWAALLAPRPVTGGFAGIMQAGAESLFSAAVLLGALYLLGLWACGAPFILAVPAFYGAGLGFTQAHFYTLGKPGVLAAALTLLPTGLLTAGLLAMAGAESLRLSLTLSRRLLPHSAESNSLWPTFRLYSLRFLLFAAVGAAVSAVDTLLRSVCIHRLF